MPLSPSIARLEALQSLHETFRALIIDLWGVMHDGAQAFPDAMAAVVAARDAGLDTVFLSNAPRTRAFTRAQLSRLGYPDRLLDAIVTSGALVRDCLRRDYRGAAVYHLGPASDSDAVADLPVDYVDDIADADVIHATGLDFRTPEDHRSLLAAALDRGAPFLCGNPDRIVYHINRMVYCAGAVADIYADMGGEVQWFGKPEPRAYSGALDEIAQVTGRNHHDAKHAVLMIGDSFQTDIAGAHAFGIKALHITDGVNADIYAGFADQSDISRMALYKAAAAHLPVPDTPFSWGPDYVMDALR